MKLNISDVLKATRGKLISGDLEYNISGVSTDTRTIKPGNLFVALKGPSFDGHNFVGEAIKKGAIAVVVRASGYRGIRASGVSIIQAKDTLKAFGDIAHYYRAKFDIPFIGISGSNGKTTTKEMLHKVLGSRFSVLKNEGTENNLVGVPKTLLGLKSDHNIGVLELGTNHFGEISRLAEILAPSTAIITNIGSGHLEFLKSRPGVFKEKTELLKSLDRDGTAILNADDELLSRVSAVGGSASGGRCRILRFGIEKDCDFKVTGIINRGSRIEFIVNGRYNFKIRLLARHNIYNALAAISAGFLYKIEYVDIYKALSEFEPVGGRLSFKNVEGVYIIDDTYNSNPQSLSGAIEALADYKTAGRKILVCADMLELGKSSARYHNEAGKAAALAGADYLISVGRFSNAVRAGALSNGMRKEAVFSCKDNSAVFDVLKDIVRERDVVLLKGSHSMRLGEVTNALSSFISAKRTLVRV